VTLEPCAHFGKTPPCADALITAGIGRVVAACEDPNPRVAGGGFAKLRAAGIEVSTGLIREPAREINRGFFSRIERGRPWVRVKLGMSLDGRTALANGASKWITGEAARTDVRHWRARSSAVLTGSGTVLADDPRLTVRLAEGVSFRPPLRVVLDRRSRVPGKAHVLDDSAPTLLFHAAATAPQAKGVECISAPEVDDGLDLTFVLKTLADRGVNELQVEAGPTLCGALFAAGLVDELLLYVAPVLFGDQAQPLLKLPKLEDLTSGKRLRVIDQRRVGDDLRLLLRE
jgi:diaminohydroxyphosphoribosylaminopyrimidine deaminase / 5-amino-6-(5-phosphoribosylamino)uracil reductase